ncbi:MAG: hypothetical protein KGL23_06835 [Acidobacteriota bacterium]|nr:hypothetical protein [Acidobacteriota bacterium]MDE3031427.1 hypothetical protein [Acidobacteriota bacterium]MDE3093543.1 hypothetical protein [Acidobacteriota bacterium]MDE3138507.1 hypothetical protein [Acidobacteriota bacterium]MDE3147128.1 hypothetical protein [Acidobacteriota bacterium]
MARLRRLRVVTSLLGAAILFSACGTGSAVAQARTSCQFVHRALALQAKSDQAGLSADERATLRGRAMSELLKATPSAAAATSSDGSWNPLMTTISEAERVPLVNLIPALTRLCQVADSSSPYL